MAPVQQTFSLIPELPSALNGGEDGRVARPPMTTKQAKKAYKAKNKGPKLSKAEQRRQELLEQDRIRREFEKERNHARAKAARDKRKEKEEKEKSEKKRKGLPIVEVHPSQDTLARFVRKPSAPPKTHQRTETQEPITLPVAHYEGQGSDETLSAGDEPGRSVKRQRTGTSSSHRHPAQQFPDDMFRGSRSNSASQAQSTVVGLSTDASIAPVVYTAVTTSNYHFDKSTTEKVVNQHMLNDSFSADDGLFDDIDIDAIDVKITEQGALHSAEAEPLPELPNPKQPHRERKSSNQDRTIVGVEDGTGNTQVTTTDYPLAHLEQRNGTKSFEPRDNRTVLTNDMTRSKSQHVESSSKEDAASNTSCDRVSCSRPSTLAEVQKKPVAGQFAGQTVTSAHTKPPTGANLVHTSKVGGKVAKPPRGPPVAAEKRSRKPSEDVTLEHAKPDHHVAKQKTSIAPNIEAHLSEKVSTPLFQKSQGPFTKANSFRSPNTPVMGPPPLPPKFKTSGQQDTRDRTRKSKFLLQQSVSNFSPKRPSECASAEQPGHMLPSSTQLFLLSNADDLFPSPSQEAAEIFEVPDKLQYSSVRPRTAPPPSRFVPPPRYDRPRTANDKYGGMAPKAVTRNPVVAKTERTGETPAFRRVSYNSTPAQPHMRAVPDFDLMPFLSTQDVLLSSQDLMELGEETPTPAVAPNPVDSARIRHGATITYPAYKLPQYCEENNPRTPIGKKDITRTVNATAPAQTPHPLDTQDRVLGPHHRSQHSSSLPDTPTVPPGKIGYSNDKVHIEPEHRKEALENKENISPQSWFTDDEVAKLLIEDLDAEHDRPESMNSGNDIGLACNTTPIAVEPSPKPFFTSSGTKEKVYLAIEKSKTTAWKDRQAHRRATEDLNILLRQEEEKQERILLDKMLEAEENGIGQMDGCWPHDPPVDENTLDLSARKANDSRARSQKSSGGSETTRGRSQPQSSFEKMLQMLENSKEDCTAGAASQDSDYGDLAWDIDDLTDI